MSAKSRSVRTRCMCIDRMEHEYVNMVLVFNFFCYRPLSFLRQQRLFARTNKHIEEKKTRKKYEINVGRYLLSSRFFLYFWNKSKTNKYSFNVIVIPSHLLGLCRHGIAYIGYYHRIHQCWTSQIELDELCVGTFNATNSPTFYYNSVITFTTRKVIHYRAENSNVWVMGIPSYIWLPFIFD